MTQENLKRRRQLFIELTSKFNKKNNKNNCGYKSEPAQSQSKQFSKHKKDILKKTLCQMNKWKTRQSAPHVQNIKFSDVQEQFGNNNKQEMRSSIIFDNNPQTRTIHDTFSRECNKTNKGFNITQIHFKKKEKHSRHHKNGLIQLANHIATPKPLGTKQKPQSQRNNQRKLRFVNFKKLRQNRNYNSTSQFLDSNYNLSKKGISDYNLRWTSQRSSSIFQDKNKRSEKLNPWYQNQECFLYKNAMIQPSFGLSDIIE